ncbi:MAG TPA: hypothetical protein VIL73_03435 [Gaiellaceae bacterium]
MRPPSKRLPFPILIVVMTVVAMMTASLVPGSGLVVMGLLFVVAFLYAARNARPPDPPDS